MQAAILILALAGQWEEARRAGGVVVFTRDEPVQNAREVQGITLVDRPPGALFDAISDYGRYTEFMPGVSEARILERAADGSFFVYFRYDPPYFFIAPRDVIVHVRLTTAEASTDGVLGSAWVAAPERLPEREGVVRMPLNTGTWRVEPVDGGTRCRLTYQVLVKPGGWIPDWLVKWGAARAIPDVMEAIRARAAAPQ